MADILFFTGAFSLDGMTVQRPHFICNDVDKDTELSDDDVVSWFQESENTLFKDGYVSNVGTVVTIHISPESSDKDISFIKKIFGLAYATEVIIVPFEGWEKELKKKE